MIARECLNWVHNYEVEKGKPVTVKIKRWWKQGAGYCALHQNLGTGVHGGKATKIQPQDDLEKTEKQKRLLPSQRLTLQNKLLDLPWLQSRHFFCQLMVPLALGFATDANHSSVMKKFNCWSRTKYMMTKLVSWIIVSWLAPWNQFSRCTKEESCFLCRLTDEQRKDKT